VGKQGALAGAGFASHANGPEPRSRETRAERCLARAERWQSCSERVPGGQCEQVLSDFDAADEAAAPILDEFLQRPSFQVLPTRQRLPSELAGLLVQVPPQVFQHLLAPLL